MSLRYCLHTNYCILCNIKITNNLKSILCQDNPEEHEDEELGEKKLKNSGGFTGRGVTLQMLLEDNILQPKEGAMSLEYMVCIFPQTIEIRFTTYLFSMTLFYVQYLGPKVSG